MLFLALPPVPADPDPPDEAEAAVPMDPPDGILGAVFAREGSGPRDFRPDDACFWGEIGARALLARLDPPPEEWCCDMDGGGGEDLLFSGRS